MIKYKVNGEYLDQFKLENFAISKAISKIGEIDLRHGDRSTSFDVPLTAKNIKILRYTPELNNYTTVNNFDAYDGQLIEDDAVISDGYYQVVKFSPTTKKASLRFYGGNSAWYALLKDRFINEENGKYNLDQFKHKYNYDNVTNSFSNSSGYFYFPFDNNKNKFFGTSKGPIGIDEFNVGIYGKDIFNKIFESVDVKLKGNLFNSVVFNQELIPAIKPLEDFKPGDYTLNFKTNASTQIPKDGTYTGLNYTAGRVDSQWDGNRFTAASDADSINFDLSFQTLRGKQFEPASNYGDIQVRVKKNNTVSFTVVLTVDYTSNITDLSGFITTGLATQYNIESFNFTSVNEGDTFDFEVTNINNSIPPFDGFFYIQKGINGVSSFLKTDLTNAITKYDISTVLPKIKQTDFVKDVMLRNGVVSQYDVKTRTLTLDKFETIENNIPNAIDWSDKIDLSKNIDVDYTKVLKGYAKKSLFTYQDDSDKDTGLGSIKTVTNQVLGTGEIDIDNDFLSDEKKVYTSPFASTVQNLTGSDKFYIPFMPMWELTGEDEDGNPEFSKQEIKPRILIAAPSQSVFSVNAGNENTVEITDDNGVDNSFSDLGYAFFAKFQANTTGLNNNDLDNINQTLNFTNYDLLSNTFFGETLLERNYNLYIKILNNPFYVSLNLNLSSLDVQSVDFLTPIYLEYKYDSGYYYIDSIEQYKGDGSTTKVNLVKI